jgi:hypothetical protein
MAEMRETEPSSMARPKPISSTPDAMRTPFPCFLRKASRGERRSKKRALATKGSAKPAE